MTTLSKRSPAQLSRKLFGVGGPMSTQMLRVLDRQATGLRTDVVVGIGLLSIGLIGGIAAFLLTRP